MSYDNWKYEKIPKIAFTYWGGRMSKLHYLSIRSMLILNPDWKVILYEPLYEYTGEVTWKTPEHSVKYSGIDYRKYLNQLSGLEIIKIDFNDIGFRNDVPEVFKSNYLTSYYLVKHGGFWFDTDVLFIKPLSKINLSDRMLHGNENTLEMAISECKSRIYGNIYYSTGILLSSPDCSFFKLVLDTIKKKYDLKNYLSAANHIYPFLFGNIKNIHKVLPDLHYADLKMDIFYVFDFYDTDTLFESEIGIERIVDSTVGIHWTNGSTISEKFLNNADYKSNVVINQIIKKYNLDFDPIY